MGANLQIELLIKARDEMSAALAKTSQALAQFEAQSRKAASAPTIKPQIDATRIKQAADEVRNFVGAAGQLHDARVLGYAERFASGLSSIAGAAAGAGGAVVALGIAAVAGAAAVGVATHKFGEHVIQLQRLAAQYDFTANQTIDLQSALSRLGLSEDAAGRALFMLNTAIEKGSPALKQLGLEGLSTYDTFVQLVDVLATMPAAQRNAFGAELLGGARGFRELSGVIARLGPELRLTSEENERFGRHFSDAEIRIGDSAHEAEDTLKDAFAGMVKSFQSAAAKFETPLLIKVKTSVEGPASPDFSKLPTFFKFATFPGIKGAFEEALNNAINLFLPAGKVAAQQWMSGFAPGIAANGPLVLPTAVITPPKPPPVAGAVEAGRKLKELLDAATAEAAADHPTPFLRRVASEMQGLIAQGKSTDEIFAIFQDRLNRGEIKLIQFEALKKILGELGAKGKESSTAIDELFATFQRAAHPEAITALAAQLSAATGTTQGLRAEIARLLATGANKADIGEALKGLTLGPSQKEADAALAAQKKAIDAVTAAVGAEDPAVAALALRFVEAADAAQSAADATRDFTPAQIEAAGKAAGTLKDELGKALSAARGDSIAVVSERIRGLVIDAAASGASIQELAGWIESLNLPPDQLKAGLVAVASDLEAANKRAAEFAVTLGTEDVAAAGQLLAELDKVAARKAALEARINVALDVNHDVRQAVAVSFEAERDPGEQARRAFEGVMRAVQDLSSGATAALGQSFTAMLFDTKDAGRQILDAWKNVLETMLQDTLAAATRPGVEAAGRFIGSLIPGAGTGPPAAGGGEVQQHSQLALADAFVKSAIPQTALAGALTKGAVPEAALAAAKVKAAVPEAGLAGAKIAATPAEGTLSAALIAATPAMYTLAAAMGAGAIGDAVKLALIGTAVAFGAEGGIVHAASGVISGPGGPKSDQIPAMLSAGEAIVNAAAVARPGVRPMLEALNAGRDLPEAMGAIKAAEGVVLKVAGGAGGPGGAGGAAGSLSVSVTLPESRPAAAPSVLTRVASEVRELRTSSTSQLSRVAETVRTSALRVLPQPADVLSRTITKESVALLATSLRQPAPEAALSARGAPSGGGYGSVTIPGFDALLGEVRSLRGELRELRDLRPSVTNNVNASSIDMRGFYEQLVAPGGALRRANTRLFELQAANG